jgi:hypothetical protein
MKCFAATIDTTSNPLFYNGQYCLVPGSFEDGQCCNYLVEDPTSDGTVLSPNCKTAPQYVVPPVQTGALFLDSANGDAETALVSWDNEPTFTTGVDQVFTAADGLTPLTDKDGNNVFYKIYREASNDAFCGSKQTISNKFLREFLMPQWRGDYYCDPYEKIQVTADAATRKRTINDPIPNLTYSYHCKYHLSADAKFGGDGYATPEADRGYIYLAAEAIGFDNNVIVIV